MPLGTPITAPTGGPRVPPNRGSSATQRQTQATIRPIIQASNLGFDQRNIDLGFQQANANIAAGYDRNKLNLDHWADMNRMNQSEFRDVDLAGQGVNDNLASAGRRLNTANDIAARRVNAARDAALGAFDIDYGRLTDQFGFDRNNYDSMGRLITSRQRSSVTERDIAMGRAGLQYDSNRRAAGDAAAGAGAATSSGYGANLSDLRSQLSLDKRGITQNWNDRQAQIGRDTDVNQINWDQAQSANKWGVQQAGLTRDTAIRGADTSYWEATANAENNWQDAQADASRARSYIDSVAKDYGITRQQMESAFKIASDRLGLDYGQITMQIAQAMASNDQQKIAAARALEQQLLLAAGQGGGGAPSMSRTPARQSSSIDFGPEGVGNGGALAAPRPRPNYGSPGYYEGAM
jgi:hypothetical protein